MYAWYGMVFLIIIEYYGLDQKLYDIVLRNLSLFVKKLKIPVYNDIY